MSDTNSQKSNSDYDSDNEYGIKLHTHKDKLDQIIKKAQSIVPWIKKEDLIKTFKEYYENESIFYTKLHKIAQKNNTKDDGQWISTSKQVQTKVQHKNRDKQFDDVESKFKNYSFLNDIQLLKRIGGQSYDQPNRGSVEVHTKDNKKYNDRNNKNYNTDKYYHNEKINKNKTQPYQKKYHTRYIQKQEQTINTKQYRNNEFNKSIKYIEKKDQQPKNNKNNNKNNKQQKNTNKNKTQQATVQKQGKPTIQEQKSIQKQIKTQVNVVSNSSINTAEINKQQSKMEVKQQQKKQKKQQTPIPSQQQKPKQPIAQQPSKKIQQIGIQINPQTKQNFQKVCKQNPYILNFIMPTNKVQKIEYVINNSVISNVKVRIVSQVE